MTKTFQMFVYISVYINFLTDFPIKKTCYHLYFLAVTFQTLILIRMPLYKKPSLTKRMHLGILNSLIHILQIDIIDVYLKSTRKYHNLRDA